MRATPLRLGESDYDEVTTSLCFYLEPVSRAAFPIRRSCFLRHDSLESQLSHLLEKCFTFRLDVIEIAHNAERGDDVLEELLAPHERDRTDVEVLERQQIECVESRGQFHHHSANLHR